MTIDHTFWVEKEKGKKKWVKLKSENEREKNAYKNSRFQGGIENSKHWLFKRMT